MLGELSSTWGELNALILQKTKTDQGLEIVKMRLFLERE